MMDSAVSKCETCKWFHSLDYADFCKICEACKCIICTGSGRHCSEYEEGLNDGGKNYYDYNRMMEQIEELLGKPGYYGWRPYPGENCLLIEIEKGRMVLATVYEDSVKFQRYDTETAEIISEYDQESHRYSLRRRK